MYEGLHLYNLNLCIELMIFFLNFPHCKLLGLGSLRLQIFVCINLNLYITMVLHRKYYKILLLLVLEMKFLTDLLHSPLLGHQPAPLSINIICTILNLLFPRSRPAKIGFIWFWYAEIKESNGNDGHQLLQKLNKPLASWAEIEMDISTGVRFPINITQTLKDLLVSILIFYTIQQLMVSLVYLRELEKIQV